MISVFVKRGLDCGERVEHIRSKRSLRGNRFLFKLGTLFLKITLTDGKIFFLFDFNVQNDSQTSA